MLPRSGACVRRPRVNGEREREILDATVALVTEVGYDRLTFDAVSSRARVSKATLYRRWPSKSDLVVEAIAQLTPEQETIDTGTVEGDVHAWAESFGTFLDAGGLELFLGVITALRHDPDLRQILEAECMAAPPKVIGQILTRAVVRGQVPADLDLEMVTQVVPAMALLKASTGELTSPAAPFLHRAVDDILLPLLRTRSGAEAAASGGHAYHMTG